MDNLPLVFISSDLRLYAHIIPTYMDRHFLHSGDALGRVMRGIVNGNWVHLLARPSVPDMMAINAVVTGWSRVTCKHCVGTNRGATCCTGVCFMGRRGHRSFMNHRTDMNRAWTGFSARFIGDVLHDPLTWI